MQRGMLRVLRYLAIVSLLSAFAGAAPAFASSDAVGAVYTQTNAAAGNAVLVFDRAADGSLSAAGALLVRGARPRRSPRAPGGPLAHPPRARRLSVRARKRQHRPPRPP